MLTKKILLVGCGKMGGALLGGILKAGIPARNILVVEPHPQKSITQSGIKTLNGFDKTKVEEFSPGIIILAVKPQAIDSLIADYRGFAEKALFVSIVAGKTIAFFTKHLGEKAVIVRTMPNLPVTVGKGVMAWYKNAAVSKEQVNLIQRLFASVGVVRQVEEEAMLDAVTAISGSGPGYVFYFMEALVEAAVGLGLSREMAKEIVVQTMIGSADMASVSHLTLAQLREAVTSPKGTTEAALEVLMSKDKLKNMMSEATKAAYARAKELAE